MNKWANTVLTEKGLALMAKLTQGNTLNITEAVTGAGFVAPGMLVKQTDVTDPKQSLVFRPVSYPEAGKCALTMALTNEDLDKAYDATQVGVFAEDPDEGKILFFIAQAIDASSGTHVPSENEMPGYSAEWTFTLKYGQADGVTVVVDPSNTVSRAEMAVYLAEFKNSLNGVDIVTTAGTGASYTATVPGITALKAGLTITIIPHTVSTDVLPTLNLNNLGAKAIRRRLTNSTATTVASATANWLGANKPIRVTYDGTYWIADLDRPNAADIYGTLSVANGGTGATTAEAALASLGAQAKHIPVPVTLSASGWSNLAQTVSVDGVTADNTVVIAPAPASHDAYTEAGVKCSAQASGELTFTCADVPTRELTVNVVILN